MATVLITGGAGFIGSHTADRLTEAGYRVKILDHLQKPAHREGRPDYLNPKAEFIFGDVCDAHVLRFALKNVSYVFHFAAYQDFLPDFSTFYAVNAFSTALLYEIIVADKLPVKKVIVSSSQFAQGEGLYRDKKGKLAAPFQRPLERLERGEWDWADESGEPMEWLWTPETHAQPPTAYAISKYAQELTALALGRRYGIPSVALRYSIVQGARQSFFSAYSGACRIFNLSYYFNKAPTIYEDGLQNRDFVDVRDVVEANMLVLENSQADYETFCVGGGRAYTILEFDRMVARAHGKEHIEPRIPGVFRLGDTRNACSDTAKLRALGWAPKYNAADSVEDYLEYLRRQNKIEDLQAGAAQTLENLQIVRKVK